MSTLELLQPEIAVLRKLCAPWRHDAKGQYTHAPWVTLYKGDWWAGAVDGHAAVVCRVPDPTGLVLLDTDDARAVVGRCVDAKIEGGATEREALWHIRTFGTPEWIRDEEHYSRDSMYPLRIAIGGVYVNARKMARVLAAFPEESLVRLGPTHFCIDGNVEPQRAIKVEGEGIHAIVMALRDFCA